MSDLIHPNYEFAYAGLFRTEEKWTHPERTEKTYEIICVTKGDVWIEEGGREYHAARGQVILLSPNIPHKGTRYTTDVGFYWVHFSVSDGSLPFEQRFFECFESQYLFKELLHCNNLSSVPEYLVNSVLLHILSELCHLSKSSVQSYNGTAEKIYEWIRINADASLNVGTVAEEFGYSPDHLSRICKKYFGVGARELINRFVVSHAKELLCNTDKYIKEIAADLDFPSDKAFIGYFKYHEGCFPSDFRNRFSKIHMNRR